MSRFGDMAKPLVEYFLLRQLTSELSGIPRSDLAELRGVVGLAYQRASAAELLWKNGHKAEGLRLVVDAFEHFATTINPASTEREDAEEMQADKDPHEPAGEEAVATAADWADLLGKRGIGTEQIHIIEDVHTFLKSASLPRHDSQISLKHEKLYHQTRRATGILRAAFNPMTLTRPQITRLRIIRMGFATLVAALMVAAIVKVTWTPASVTAVASAAWSNEFSARNAIDDDVDTEWLLPDRRKGWIEFNIVPPRYIEKIRILNAHNRHHNDRATKEFRIDLYSDDEKVESIKGSFETFSESPEWREFDVSTGDVTRVRITVLGYHLAGGGLAEVELE